VADHPLRPATDQSLGGPLPHQLANPTRAPPIAINLSRFPGLCGISRSFPRLSPTTGQVPTRYSPVRHSPETEAPGAFDLHVLGMPPAFVLSQDQTLKFIPGRAPLLMKIDPNKGLQTFASLREHQATPQPYAGPAAVRASLPSSPQSQTTLPHGSTDLKRGRAYTPHPNSRQHPNSSANRGCRRASRAANAQRNAANSACLERRR
jgi:hypothetical protein